MDELLITIEIEELEQKTAPGSNASALEIE